MSTSVIASQGQPLYGFLHANKSLKREGVPPPDPAAFESQDESHVSRAASTILAAAAGSVVAPARSTWSAEPTASMNSRVSGFRFPAEKDRCPTLHRCHRRRPVSSILRLPSCCEAMQVWGRTPYEFNSPEDHVPDRASALIGIVRRGHDSMDEVRVVVLLAGSPRLARRVRGARAIRLPRRQPPPSCGRSHTSVWSPKSNQSGRPCSRAAFRGDSRRLRGPTMLV